RARRFATFRRRRPPCKFLRKRGRRGAAAARAAMVRAIQSARRRRPRGGETLAVMSLRWLQTVARLVALIAALLVGADEADARLADGLSAAWPPAFWAAGCSDCCSGAACSAISAACRRIWACCFSLR